ncbi:MAG: hypothetical protein EBZ23_12940 [Rhodobacteraceae bacterium]|nr:hypothetical protein [Paracoccaceae bacterium]
MDRRFQAYNERVAANDLKSDIDHHNFVHPERCQITVPICDLLDLPNGDRQRQLLYGAPVDVFEDVDSDNYFMVHPLMCLKTSQAGPLCVNTRMDM